MRRNRETYFDDYLKRLSVRSQNGLSRKDIFTIDQLDKYLTNLGERKEQLVIRNVGVKSTNEIYNLYNQWLIDVGRASEVFEEVVPREPKHRSVVIQICNGTNSYETTSLTQAISEIQFRYHTARQNGEEYMTIDIF